MSRLCLILRAVFGQRLIRVPFHLLGYLIELINVGPCDLLIQVHRIQFLSTLLDSLSVTFNRALIEGRHC